MVRHALALYNLLISVNADKRRNEDCYWNNAYGVNSAPLVRTIIDCLYSSNRFFSPLFLYQGPFTAGFSRIVLMLYLRLIIRLR